MHYLKKIQVIKCHDMEAGVATAMTMKAGQEEGTLYITDSSVIARQLTLKDCAVLICLHEGNRREDFSFCRFAYEGQRSVGAKVLDVEGPLTEVEISAGECLDKGYLERVYRRCRELPWDILETERCLIRETTVKDVEDFYRIYSDSSITQFMEPLYEDPEEERSYARDYIRQVYAFYDFGIWTVAEKVSGEVIGRAGLCYREGFEEPELGFVIAADRQGRGLATEVCSAILQYGYEELGFERILAFVQPDNEASRRVCDKLGMTDSGRVMLQGQEYVVYVWTPLCSKNEKIIKFSVDIRN